jgi:hypothetical protein
MSAKTDDRSIYEKELHRELAETWLMLGKSAFLQEHLVAMGLITKDQLHEARKVTDLWAIGQLHCATPPTTSPSASGDGVMDGTNQAEP